MSKQQLSSLNAEFSIPAALRFESGKAGLPYAHLMSSTGSTADVYLHGAHATSWKSQGAECLFLSKKAVFENGKHIRGGIPIVFPQFGPGKMPSHGFARISDWEVRRTNAHPGESVSLVLGLSSSPQTKQFWDADFDAEIEFQLSNSFQQIFRVANTGQDALSFQCAFHTYFSIEDIVEVEIEGLSQKSFLDNTKNRESDKDHRAHITFQEETDRIYQESAQNLRIADRKGKKSFLIEQTSMRDAVVWNPWSERCAQIADLELEDYKRFVCVEPGNVSNPIALGPGETWRGSQILKVEKTTQQTSR
jgi:glucose-6-phosphate 1-epimerase